MVTCDDPRREFIRADACRALRRTWLAFAWEVGIHGNDRGGIGHDRMATMRTTPRTRRPGFGEAYAAAGYCAVVVRCRTYAMHGTRSGRECGPGNH